MRTVIALTTLALLACSTTVSDVPKYTTKLESVAGDTWSLHLDSVSMMSEEDVKRALLTEAARATIDRGRIYLVVHELLNEGASVDVKEKTGIDPSAPQSANANDQAMRSEVSLSRTRSGSIRFTIFREIPAGTNVFDASQLLDRLKRGELPM